MHIFVKHSLSAIHLVGLLVEKIKICCKSLVKKRLKTVFNVIFEPDVAVALILAHFVKKERVHRHGYSVFLSSFCRGIPDAIQRANFKTIVNAIC
jgi:ribonucleotide reductase beta subunit family protein with ferritin-like domain